MAKSGGGGEIAIAIVFIVIALVAFIMMNNNSTTKKSSSTSSSPSSSPSQQQPEEETTKFSNLSIQIPSLTRIIIDMTITGTLPESININIYSDSNLQTSVANVSVTNIDNNFSYTWDGITQLLYDTGYYIKITSTETSTQTVYFMIPQGDILNACRNPIAFTIPEEESERDRIMKSIFTEMIPMLVVGMFADDVLGKVIGKLAGTFVGIHTYLKEVVTVKSELRLTVMRSVEKGLIKTDRLYKISKLFNVLSPEQVARIGLSATDYLKKLQKIDPKKYKEVIKSIDDTAKLMNNGKTIGQIARITAAKAGIDSSKMTAKLVAKSVSTFLNVLSIVGMGVDIADMVCQATGRTGGQGPFNCPPWSQIDERKTSDFLVLRENAISNTITDYDFMWQQLNASSSKPPPITEDENIYLNLIGPLSKVKPNVKREQIFDTMIRMLFIGDTVSNDDMLRRYSVTFRENNKSGPVSDVNTIPQIAIIRRIQGKIVEPFVRSMECVLPSTCKRSNFMGAGLAEGTFEVRRTYSNLPPIVLQNYEINNGVDFARGASFTFSNPGIPVDENFYVRFNGTHIAFIIGHITCSAVSPVVFAGYFLNNKGIEIPKPSFGGPITTLEVGVLHEPKPSYSPKSCGSSPITPNGSCIANAFGQTVLDILNESDWDDLFRVANEYVCTGMYNGKYIKKNNQCSYKTATACHGSYKWPEIIETNSKIWPELTFGINTDPSVNTLFDNIKNSKQISVYKKDVFVLTNTYVLRYKNFYDGITKTGNFEWTQPSIIFQGTQLNCFTIYKQTIYIGENSGNIIKIINFIPAENTSPGSATTPSTIVYTNFMSCSSPPSQNCPRSSPISIAMRDGEYMLIAYSDRISKIKDTGTKGKIITDNFISNTGTRQVSISNPTYIIFENPYIFVLNDRGKKISRISYDSYNDIKEDWYIPSFSPSPSSLNMSMTYMCTEKTEDEDVNMYVSIDSEILKINDCTSSSVSHVVETDIIKSTLSKIDEQLTNSEDSLDISWLSFNGSATDLLNRIDNPRNKIKYVIRCNDTLVYSRINESNVYGLYGQLSWDETFPGTEPVKQEQYAEWRTNFDHLKRDLGTDFSDDTTAQGGICVAWNYVHRMQCSEIVTDSGRVNTYNINTGECINTPQFCNAYGVPLERSVPIERLGKKEKGVGADQWLWRASGPLDSCVIPEIYKALDWTLLSRNLLQPFVAMGYTLASHAFRINIGKMGFATLRGIFNFGRPNSGLSSSDIDPITMGSTYMAAAQGSTAAYLALAEISINDYIKKLEEDNRANRCKCTYRDGPWTQFIQTGSNSGPIELGALSDYGACVHESVDNKRLSFRKGKGACPDGYYRNSLPDAWCEAAMEYGIDSECSERRHKLAYEQKNAPVGNYIEDIATYCYRTVSPKPWNSCGRPDLPYEMPESQVMNILLDNTDAVYDRPNLDPLVKAAVKQGIAPETVLSERYKCVYENARSQSGDKRGVQTRGLTWDPKCTEAAKRGAINKLISFNDERVNIARECNVQNDPSC